MEILKKEYVTLFLISFVIITLFKGLFSGIFISIILTISKYLYDKYIVIYVEPYIIKFIEWIKSKIKKS